MRYLALACDFDGTLALDSTVSEDALAALTRLRDSGRKLVLVTGRKLDDLLAIFSRADLFDRVVAENGGLLYRPASRDDKPLADPPPAEFLQALRARQVAPVSAGRVIVSTCEPNERAVLETIRDLGLELGVIFNRGAVMVLPSGVNKATGLAAALDELGLSPHNCVAIGDAENDHALLALAECAVAVADALPALRERADWVTAGRHGAGVVELCDALVASDLAELAPRLRRHEILLGANEGGEEVRLQPHGVSVLVAGSSGSGKSTFATAVLERLAEQGYQFCIVDPEGDYATLDGTIILGDRQRPPVISEVLDVLAKPGQNGVVNLLGLALADRPAFFSGLLPRLQELRARVGRPHWLVVDEAHHLLPASAESVPLTLPQDLSGAMLITVHPDHVARAILGSVDMVVAIGAGPGETLGRFADALGEPLPALPRETLAAGEALLWPRRSGGGPAWLKVAPPRAEHRRHVRKYASGDLGEDRSFYFRGPEGKLRLRAQNLSLFVQLAEGVDDETWLHHLGRHDYSTWFRDAIKDDDLAAAGERIERLEGVSARESRAMMRAAIEDRYTMPA